MKENNVTNTLESFFKLTTLPEITGTWFNNKEVHLDGFKFIGCRFDNCRLTISSTNFELEKCFLDQETLVLFTSEIAKPIRIYNRKNELAYTHAPFFAPTKNEDGTISITI
jgi:hypothetical protein